MNAGIYTRDQVPREQYDRLPQINISRLEWIEQSPAHLNHILTNGADEDTDAMIRGRATHLAVFEPELFRERCVVWEGASRRGKEWDAFCARNRGKELLTEKMHETAVAIGQAVRRDRYAAPFLEHGRGELTLIWKYVAAPVGAVAGYEFDCKGRIDFETDRALVDLKTTEDASPSAFARTALNLNYLAKAAWYTDAHRQLARKLREYFIVAAETKAPYVVQVYRIPEDLLELGRAKYREWLDRYAFCRARNSWPGYGDGPTDLVLPEWAQPYDEEGGDPTGLGLSIGG